MATCTAPLITTKIAAKSRGSARHERRQNLMAAESGGCRGEAQPSLACGTVARRQRDRHDNHGEDVDRARVNDISGGEAPIW
jgi:hypothetical protein